MIKPNELRNLTPDEIRQKLEVFKQDLFTLRSEARSGRIEKPHRIHEVKTDIARCETILREKAHAARNTA